MSAGDTPEPQRAMPISRAGVIRRLRLALSFLVIVPTTARGSVDSAELAESFGYFPLAGFLIGLSSVGSDRLLGAGFGIQLRSLLIVLWITVLTGALHLDGLADTADAIGARGDRARALEIMRDSRIGCYGVIAIFFDLALKSLTLAAISSASARIAALILAPTLARFSMVAVSHHLDYLRSPGAGSLFLGNPRQARRNLAVASSLTLFACLIVAILRPELTLFALAVSMLVSALIRAIYRRWMGGVTGDMLGAAGEIVEFAVLLIFAAAAGEPIVSV
jgi:adenosylcobinamide-GDP ribazoletransferase